MTLIATGQPLATVLAAVERDAQCQLGRWCAILPVDPALAPCFGPLAESSSGAAAEGDAEAWPPAPSAGFSAAVAAFCLAGGPWAGAGAGVGSGAGAGAGVGADADVDVDSGTRSVLRRWVSSGVPWGLPRGRAETPLQEAAGLAGYKSLWFEPIQAPDGRLLGALASAHPAARVPTADETAAIVDAAHVASIAIERERGSRALRDSQALLATKTRALEATLERMEQGVMMVSPQQVVEVCNRRAIELLGLPAALMASRPTFTQVLEYQWSTDEFSATPEHIREFVRAGGILDRPQCYERTRPNGVVIELRSVPIEGGGVLRTYTDVTELRRAEAKRLALEAQLLDARKLEAIGTLAGGIAHDFNNIMAAILGNAALAGQDVAAGHPAQAHLQQIGKAGRRARSLVQQILAFSRHQPDVWVKVPLLPLVEEAAAMLRAAAGTEVELVVVRPPGPLATMGDPTQLQQVLMNLGTNAWQALPAGRGQIEIGIETVHQTCPPAGLTAGAHVHLWVRDDGCGIEEATRRRLFEPFFTTKPPGQGTGLGLAVVHGIVKAMGGAIEVGSTPGQGSCFDVYLPLVELESQPSALDEAAVVVPRGQGQQVLVVDDDEVMALLVQSLLQRLGYRSHICLDARAAVDLVRGGLLAPDLVFTDYNMPGITGLELAQALKSVRPGLPVVIASGYVCETLRAGAAQAGVSAVMQKEQTLEMLGAVVHAALNPQRQLRWQPGRRTARVAKE
ncbi:MAG: ATP-binding protein [Rubrivivax sp.]